MNTDSKNYKYAQILVEGFLTERKITEKMREVLDSITHSYTAPKNISEFVEKFNKEFLKDDISYTTLMYDRALRKLHDRLLKLCGETDIPVVRWRNVWNSLGGMTKKPKEEIQKDIEKYIPEVFQILENYDEVREGWQRMMISFACFLEHYKREEDFVKKLQKKQKEEEDNFCSNLL